MIPKIIHYCWFSDDEYPPLIKRCIKSWKRRLPDYEFKLWDANSFDFDSVPYLREAMALKKYAFVSDYIRLYALYNYGGIYFDSDVMVFKRFDDLHKLKFFTGVEYRSGEPVKYWLESAIMGAQPKMEMIQDAMRFYEERPFIKPDGSYDIVPAPNVFTPVFQKYYDWNPGPDAVTPEDGVCILGTKHIRNSEYPQWPRPVFYHCNSQSWIGIGSSRGKLYRYCKANNLQYEYKIFATTIQKILKIIRLQN